LNVITIAVVNSKGGVGKTTLAAALAVRAAQDSERVAIVDMDPQRSLISWWQRRGRTDNPCIFEGADTAHDAVERLQLDGWDIVIMDGPPAFLSVIQEMVAAADFTLIPVKPSVVDLLATQDAVSLAREADARFLVVFNDCAPKERVVEEARRALFNHGVPIAESKISHRTSHVNSMTVGKTASEVNKGKDTVAAAEIDALWQELKKAAAAPKVVPVKKRARA
jgi:chromosome partitioning protein